VFLPQRSVGQVRASRATSRNGRSVPSASAYICTPLRSRGSREMIPPPTHPPPTPHPLPPPPPLPTPPPLHLPPPPQPPSATSAESNTRITTNSHSSLPGHADYDRARRLKVRAHEKLRISVRARDPPRGSAGVGQRGDRRGARGHDATGVGRVGGPRTNNAVISNAGSE